MTYESLGLKLETENVLPDASGVTIKSVSSESPAFNVLVANDILLAMAGERVTLATLPAQLAKFNTGERVPKPIFRHDRLLDVSMTLTARPTIAYTIAEDPNATPEQKSLREAWLKGGKR